MMDRFRPNVAAILRRGDGDVLVGERVGLVNAWQFPQGGVDEGESLLLALERELREEIGVPPQKYEVRASRGGYRYSFPHGVKMGRWTGQEQTYFLCDYKGTGAEEEFRLDCEHPEFSQLQWVKPEAFQLVWLPDFKREVYRQVFRDMLGISLH